MGKSGLTAKVICFTCRQTRCACVAGWNDVVPDLRGGGHQLTRVFAWLGGACAAGMALGAALAVLFGG